VVCSWHILILFISTKEKRRAKKKRTGEYLPFSWICLGRKKKQKAKGNICRIHQHQMETPVATVPTTEASAAAPASDAAAQVPAPAAEPKKDWSDLAEEEG
jgi:hypothetical protein